MTVLLWLRRISAHEYAQGGMLLWWAVALSNTPQALRTTNPLYVKMTAYLPYWAWIAMPLVLVVWLIGASLARRQRVLIWCMVAVVGWWAVIAYLLWSVTSTYLTPGFAVIFTLAAMFRYSELRPRP
jgi:FtsH-binding integral membrane protein